MRIWKILLIPIMLLIGVLIYVWTQTFTETFYMRVNGPGSAPETIAGAWDLNDVNNGNNWATVDSDDGKLGPNDRLIVLDDDGIFRGKLIIQKGGLAGKPITIQGESGGSPKIYGSDQVTGWTVYSGNIWQATLSGSIEARPVWLIETGGNITHGDRKTSIGGLSNEGDYYHDRGANTLYLYAATDPDTRYTSVEAAQRYDGILGDGPDIDYITIEGLEVAFAGYTDGAGSSRPGVIHIHDSGMNNWIIQDSYLHHGGDEQVEYGHVVRLTGMNHTVRRCTITNGARHNISILATSGNATGMTIEENEFKDGPHTMGVDIQLEGTGNNSNHTIRRNYFHDVYESGNIQSALFMQGYDSTHKITNIYFYGNVVKLTVGTGAYGMNTDDYVGTVYLYNNTWYLGQNNKAIKESSTTGGAATYIVKNNIGHATGNVVVDLITATNKTFDFNSWWRPSGDVIEIGASRYSTWAAYNSATGWDNNGTHSGNDFVDPLLNDPANGDFTLQATSPCIDVGVNLGTPYDQGPGPGSSWPDTVEVLDQDEHGKPNQASCQTPLDEATGISVNPTLTSLAYGNAHYWDIGAIIRKGGSHIASQWQIDDDGGDWSTPVYDSGEDGSNLTSIDTSAGLTESTPYDWRVRHKNEHGWSDWASKFDFITGTGEPPPPGPALGIKISGGGTMPLEYSATGIPLEN